MPYRASALRRFLLLLLLLLPLVQIAAPSTARADDVADEADLHFRIGAQRYEARDFQGALEHFLASNRLVPNKNVVFNIARAYEQLGRAPDAFRYYQVALEGEKDAGARRRIEQAIERILPSVAVLRVETEPPGATVYLDRRDLGARGTTPRVLGLAPARHTVIVEKPGYEPAEAANVDVRLGAEARVALTLVPIVGRLIVRGEPEGAEVRVDDPSAKPVCVIPCNVELASGRRVLFVTKEGYQSTETVVTVPARAEVTSVVRLSAVLGALVVNADVRDALISVDGKPSGFTPAVLNVPVGRHTVRLSAPGFRTFETEVVVQNNDQVRVDVQLTQRDEVTAASRVTESAEDAPASVSIVTREELRAMGYPTIGEALRGIRGVYLSDDRSYVSVGVRGFSRPGDYGNRILVLLDGHPLNDNYIWSSYVGFDARVDLDDIERIEIVRGPGSVVYGTGAFLGVINLITRPKGEKTHGEVALGTAENAVFRSRGTAVVKLGEDAGMWVSVAGATSSGRDHYFPEYHADPTSPDVERDAYGRPVDGIARNVDGFGAGTFGARAWYKAFSLQAFLSGRRKTLPTGEYETIFNDQRTRFNDLRGFVEARFDPRLSETVQLQSRVSLDLYDFSATLAYPPPGGVGRDRYRGRWAGTEVRCILTPSERLRFTAGGEFISHFLTRQTGSDDQGPIVFDAAGNPGRNDPFAVAAGYALADWGVSPRVKVSAGARLDYYSNLPRFDLAAQTNPRLAVIWKPYDRGNVKVLAGKAFRAPSVYELFYTSTTQVPAENLGPEQIYSGEVEYSHRFSTTVVGSITGFTNYVTDLIELRDVQPGINQYTNSSANVIVPGGEAELRREWREGFMAAAQYTIQAPQYVGDGALRDVPNAPNHLASVRAAAPIVGRSLMIMSRLTLEGARRDRFDRDTDPPQGRTHAGVVWDIVFSGEIERIAARYNIGLYNAADQRYDTVPSSEFRQRTIVQNGRTVLASVMVAF